MTFRRCELASRLEQVVDIGTQLRGIRIPMPIHFPRRPSAQTIVDSAPFADRGIRLAKTSVVAVVRRHGRHAVRRLEWHNRTHGRKGCVDADTELDRQLIGGRRTIDEDVLSVEDHRPSARGGVHLIEMTTELLRDTATWDLRPHAGHRPRGDVHLTHDVLFKQIVHVLPKRFHILP